MGRNSRKGKGKSNVASKGVPRGVKPPAADSTTPPAEAANKPSPTAVGAGAMVDPKAAVVDVDSDSDSDPEPIRKRLRRVSTRLIDSEADEDSDGDASDGDCGAGGYYQECGGEDPEDYDAFQASIPTVSTCTPALLVILTMTV